MRKKKKDLDWRLKRRIWGIYVIRDVVWWREGIEENWFEVRVDGLDGGWDGKKWIFKDGIGRIRVKRWENLEKIWISGLNKYGNDGVESMFIGNEGRKRWKVKFDGEIEKIGKIERKELIIISENENRRI